MAPPERTTHESGESSKENNSNQDSEENSSKNAKMATDNTVAVQERGDGAVAQPEDPEQPPQQDQGVSYFGVAKTLIVRALIIYFITGFFRRPATTKTGPDGIAPPPSANLYENGTVMDMYIYISESINFGDFDKADSLIWYKPGLTYGDWYGGPTGDGIYSKSAKLSPSKALQNNGSIYMHVYFVQEGKSPNPKDESYSSKYTVYKSKMLNKFKKIRYPKTHNLLTGATSLPGEHVKKAENMTSEIVSHWHPNMTINIVDDHTAWVQGSVPPPLDEYVEFDMSSGKYYPIVYLNDYWNLLREYQPINETVKRLDLTITYQPLSLFRWQMYSAQAMRNKWTSYAFLGEGQPEETDEEQDTLKETLLETNPYLLGITVVVSILHKSAFPLHVK